MSHFVTIVLVDEVKDNVEAQLNEILAPYDENIDVDPYEEACWCVGRIARESAIHSANDHLGKDFVQKQRDYYWGLSGDERERVEFKNLVKPYVEMEDTIFENHILRDKPDPECKECNKTGISTSTYNPKSKWDWWAIGGRWTGYLGDYNPSEDPENLEICINCNGSGVRNDQHVQGKCNGCDGKGKSVMWPTQWKSHSSDIFKVSNIEWSDDKVPFSIVTPDGEWHQKGDMGWFGMSSNEKDDWKEVARNILYKHKGCIGIVVDCHI